MEVRAVLSGTLAVQEEAADRHLGKKGSSKWREMGGGGGGGGVQWPDPNQELL